MRFVKAAPLLAVMLLAVACTSGSDSRVPGGPLPGGTAPGLRAEGSTSVSSTHRPDPPPSTDLDEPAAVAASSHSSWVGGWDVAFSLFTGDHHRSVTGTGFLNVGANGACSMEAQVRHGAFYGGGSGWFGWFEDVTATLDRSGVLALSSTSASDTENAAPASSDPMQRVHIWRVDPPSMTPSDLVLSPADLHRWPPRLLCALTDVPAEGGSWDVASAIAYGERDRIASFSRRFPTRSDCHAVWSSALDAAPDHLWNESRFTGESIEVTRSDAGPVTVLLRNDARFSVLRLELTPAPARDVTLAQAAASQAASQVTSVDLATSCEEIAATLFTR